MGSQTNQEPLIGLTCGWDEEKQRDYLDSAYFEAVAAAGGVPVLIPLVPGAAAALTARIDGVILTGNFSDMDPAYYGQPRRPEVVRVHARRDATEMKVLEQAFLEKKPLLGICFGMQSLNIFLGGTLVQHIPASVPDCIEHEGDATRHDIHLEPGTLLSNRLGGTTPGQVNSTHHQSIDQLGRGLRVVARAPDGVIEAVEGTDPDHFVVAVQWHPERIWRDEPLSALLFTEVVKTAQRTSARRTEP